MPEASVECRRLRRGGVVEMQKWKSARLQLLAGTCLSVWVLGAIDVSAQVDLPPVSVNPAKQVQPRKAAPPKRKAQAPQPKPAPAPVQVQAPPGLQTGQAGTQGYVATRSTSGTRTDTPIINIPQSVSVLTREFIRDQSAQSLNDVLRYVPGVIPHQGEGNRDDVVIRGQRSNADFYVNGYRDDVQRSEERRVGKGE